MGNMMLDKFFALGDKATGGNPIKKATFDYYLLWTIFIAFLTVGIGNALEFWKTGKMAYIGWAVVMLCILYFQYFTLKQARSTLKMMNDLQISLKDNKKPEALPKESIESTDKMMEEFGDTKLSKNGNKTHR